MPTLTRNVQGLFDTVTNDFVGFLDPVTRTEYYIAVQKAGAYPPQLVNGERVKLLMVTTDSSATPGNVTNNAYAGVVAVAAAGQTITVTNSQVTTTSIIQLTLLTNDGTAKSAVAVPANGSFTVTLNAAATGIVKVAFLLVN